MLVGPSERDYVRGPPVNVTTLVAPQFAICNPTEVRTDAVPNTLQEERSYKIGSKACRPESEPP